MTGDDEALVPAAIERRREDAGAVIYRDHVHARKAAVASIGIVGIVLLVLLADLDPEYGAVTISGIVFYILGNGVAAKRGQAVEPVIRGRVIYGRRATD